MTAGRDSNCQTASLKNTYEVPRTDTHFQAPHSINATNKKMFMEIYRSPVLCIIYCTMDVAMSSCSRLSGLAAAFSILFAVSGCNYYTDRMSVGQQQFQQGKYRQAEEAFSAATTAAEDWPATARVCVEASDPVAHPKVIRSSNSSILIDWSGFRHDASKSALAGHRTGV